MDDGRNCIIRRIRRGLSRKGRSILIAQRLADYKLVRSFYCGDIAPNPDLIRKCDDNTLCESLPLILTSLATLPLWLHGLRAQMNDAIRERIISKKCVAQCFHFLISCNFVPSLSLLREQEIKNDNHLQNDHQFLDEARWSSIAETLLSSPAGFRLQVPRKILLYDPFLLTPVQYIRVERVFASNTRPLLLSLHGKSSQQTISRVIYKEGDDLRQDMGILQIFKAMNILWERQGMKTRLGNHLISIATYGVCAFSSRVGCIELVQGVRALTEVKANDIFSTQQLNRLVATAAGGYVAAHVTGIRDRHSDNVLIADDGKCLHIDFGHVLDDKVCLDTDFFATTPELRSALGSKRWNEFCDACVDAFLGLRENADILSEIAATVFQSIADKTKVTQVINKGLLLIECPDDNLAARKIRGMVQAGPDAVLTRLKNQVHAIAVRRIPTNYPYRIPSAIATGFLYKRGEGAGSGWRRRFFALLPPISSSSSSSGGGFLLYYFGSDSAWFSMRDDGSPNAHKGVIELDSVQEVTKVQILEENDESPSSSAMPSHGLSQLVSGGDRQTVSDLSTMTLRVSSPRFLSRSSSASSSSSFTTSRSSNDTTYRFALVTPTRIWHLRTENAKDYFRWVALLAKYSTPKSSSSAA